ERVQDHRDTTVPADNHTEHDADRDRETNPDHEVGPAVDHVLLETSLRPLLDEAVGHLRRACEEQRRDLARRPERLPRRQRQHERDAAEECGFVPLVETPARLFDELCLARGTHQLAAFDIPMRSGVSSTICQIVSSTSRKRVSRLSRNVRGRSKGTSITPFTRPGRALITATRSARNTASLI